MKRSKGFLKKRSFIGTLTAGLGQGYKLDNGDEIVFRKLPEGLGLPAAHIAYCEPSPPDQKAQIERLFKLINIRL
ncbi:MULTISPECIES: hypothetical protein [Pseudomonas]|uniref:hypothetical protein n=1 Tax=Pseudomonas TaxID=286 RepID=UPI000DA61BEE|nr:MULTISPECIES: hypothetical protein [Pseudomonas]MBD1554824.1 hypothetical protein [Pseudomonas typographi]